MRHCLLRAKQLINPDCNDFDIMIIEILIMFGLAKKQKPLINKYGEAQTNRRLYHLRYGGKLIAPIIDVNNFQIITFLPIGKRVSSKKFYRSRIDDNYINTIKRLKRKKR